MSKNNIICHNIHKWVEASIFHFIFDKKWNVKSINNMAILTIAEVQALAKKYNANQETTQGAIIDFDQHYGFVGPVEVNGGDSWGGWRLYGDFSASEYGKLAALAKDIGLRDPAILTSTLVVLLVTEKVILEWEEADGVKKEKAVYLGKLKQINRPDVDFNGAYRLNLKIDKVTPVEGESLLEDWPNAFESDGNGVFKDKTGKPVRIRPI